MEVKKEYSNRDITIVWKPKLCIHSANCVNGLPDVFKPKEKPWIQLESASSDELIRQIEQCPSGALSYYHNNNEQQTTTMSNPNEEVKVQVLVNGPLIVKGSLDITHTDGANEKTHKQVAFCRCGSSKNKPYCDGNHKSIGFQG